MWLRKQNVQLIFLQETYSSKTEEQMWANEWGGQAFFSHGTQHSKGVMTLVHHSCDINVNNSITNNNGRFIILETEIESSPFIFVNVYSPNNLTKQKHFFDDIHSCLENYVGDNIVIGGDFNCALTHLDKEGGAPIEQKQPLINKVNSIMKEAQLIDIWRELNTNKKQFTWREKAKNIHCRLDYFLMSKHLKKYTENCYITYAPECDHSAIVFQLQTSHFKHKRGPGFWKFNNSLLTDKPFTDELRKNIEIWKKSYSDLEDKRLAWDLIKMEIRNFSRYFSIKKAKTKQNLEKTYSEQINEIMTNLYLRLKIKMRKNW